MNIYSIESWVYTRGVNLTYTLKRDGGLTMRSKPYPGQKLLKHMFFYDDLTGELVRNYNQGQCKAGDSLGCLHKASGYMVCKIDMQNYQVHKLVWIWHNGELPEHGLKCVGDRSDTTISNWYKVDPPVELLHAPVAEVSFL